MKIFKFGGASTKDAENIKNVASVIKQTDEKDLVVVVSAMGKMTNALEIVVDDYFSENGNYKKSLRNVYDFHYQILVDLFNSTSHPCFLKIDGQFEQLQGFLENNKSKNHAFVYDQVVSYGELIASEIISSYLSETGIKNQFLDVRKCIKTDDNYRDANVNWKKTQHRISELVQTRGITVTQGFLGAEDINNFTLNYFTLWIIIGLCFSYSFRMMTDNEVTIWVRGIFDNRYLNFEKYRKKEENEK